MSWAEVQKLKEKMTELANATLHINVGTAYAGRTLMLKQYTSDFLNVTLDSQGTAEVSVPPRSRYELVTNDALDGRTSDVFFVDAGEYKEVHWDLDVKDGDTILPIDSVPVWLQCASLGDVYPYTTVAQVLADSACLTAVLSNDNANKYLARSTTIFGDILSTDTGRTMLGNVKAVRDKIATTISMSTAVGALAFSTRKKIFKHTNTTSVNANVSSYSGTLNTFAFTNGDQAHNSVTLNNGMLQYDKSITTGENYNNGSGVHYYYYDFASPMILKGIRFCSGCTADWQYYARGMTIQAFDSAANKWIDLGTGTTNTAANQIVEASCANNVIPFTQYRVQVENFEWASGGNYIGCAELEWWGIQPAATA